MLVVIVRFRVRSPEARQEICHAFQHAYEAYQSAGWGGGRCMVSLSDPQEVVLVEQWGSRAALAAWENSPARLRYEQQTAHLLAGPTQAELFEEL
jgi:quinol monooxygenase YgiN